MSEISDLLHKVYGKSRPPVAEVKPKGPPPALIPTEKPKTVGDVTISLEAQRIYSPDIPPAPPSAPKGPQAGTGTVSEMDAKSKWDKGNA